MNDANIEIACPHCGEELAVPTRYAGTSGKCRRCGQGLTVPPVASGTDATRGTPVRDRQRGTSRLPLWSILAAVLLCVIGGTIMAFFSQTSSETAESPGGSAANAVRAGDSEDHGPTTEESSRETRIRVHFPTDPSLGTCICPDEEGILLAARPAQGVVDFPASSLLYLQLNADTLREPTRLSDVSPTDQVVLVLEGEDATDEAVSRLVAHAGHFRHIRVQESALTTKGIEHLSKIPALESLAFVKQKGTASLLTSLDTLESVKILEVQNGLIGEDDIGVLAELAHLQCLRITEPPLVWPPHLVEGVCPVIEAETAFFRDPDFVYPGPLGEDGFRRLMLSMPNCNIAVMRRKQFNLVPLIEGLAHTIYESQAGRFSIVPPDGWSCSASEGGARESVWRARVRFNPPSAEGIHLTIASSGRCPEDQIPRFWLEGTWHNALQAFQREAETRGRVSGHENTSFNGHDAVVFRVSGESLVEQCMVYTLTSLRTRTEVFPQQTGIFGITISARDWRGIHKHDDIVQKCLATLNRIPHPEKTGRSHGVAGAGPRVLPAHGRSVVAGRRLHQRINLSGPRAQTLPDRHTSR